MLKVIFGSCLLVVACHGMVQQPLADQPGNFQIQKPFTAFRQVSPQLEPASFDQPAPAQFQQPIQQFQSIQLQTQPQFLSTQPQQFLQQVPPGFQLNFAQPGIESHAIPQDQPHQPISTLQAFSAPTGTFQSFAVGPQPQFNHGPVQPFAQFQSQPFNGLVTGTSAPVALGPQPLVIPIAAPAPAPEVATNPAPAAGPVYLGTFSKAKNNVEGDIFMLDESTLYIQGFSFDGQAPDVYFWSEGVPIPYYTRADPSVRTVVTAFNKEDVVLLLPPERPTVHHMDKFTIWCRLFDVTFGEFNMDHSMMV